MTLSTQPYKGARDFFPEDKRLQQYLFATWRQVAESFGYEEYDAPILEPLELYLAKTGEEIVNHQTYVLEDRGGRKVVLRPEMTPTVSRMVAARRQELAYPLRWYSIPNVWRYERPQRGRLREHWQLNVDIFGVADTRAEREMILMVDAIFKAFGADSSMYTIRLNHRGLIDYLLRECLKLPPKAQHGISKLIDRMHKMERPAFVTAVDELLTAEDRKRGVTEQLLQLLDAKDISDLPEEARQQPAAQELTQLIAQLKADKLHHVTFNSTLMRGFDYYSGIIFEVFDTDPVNSRSILGGGRYDGLVGLFGVDPVPTVGFGWGDVSLVNFLSVHHLLPKVAVQTDVYVVSMSESADEASHQLATTLRAGGLNAALAMGKRKIGDQLKTANKKAIPYVVIIGEDEMEGGRYTLKELAGGKEIQLAPGEVAQHIKKTRGK